MAYTTIDNPVEYFNTVLYTGTGASNARTGVGFQPDWVWIKGRSGATDHALYDAVRGVTKQLESNTTTAETTEATGLTAFGTDGFTVGALAQLNTSAATYVAWNWLANGAGVSNTDGTISSTVSANTTSGFSIVSYTGNATLSQTIGHGLGVAPRMIIFKTRSGDSDWGVYHESMTNTKRIILNQTGASGNFTWGGSPTSSVFYVNNDGLVNGSGSTYIAYCFAEVKGFSKFGSYTGNGSADGTFTYTGFKPSFILVKNTTTAGTNWQIVDNKRVGYNGANHRLYPDDSAAESTTQTLDILSNGFKAITTNNLVNASGGTYIYMAFAENPFVSSTGIPTTAR